MQGEAVWCNTHTRKIQPLITLNHRICWVGRALQGPRVELYGEPAVFNISGQCCVIFLVHPQSKDAQQEATTNSLFHEAVFLLCRWLIQSTIRLGTGQWYNEQKSSSWYGGKLFVFVGWAQHWIYSCHLLFTYQKSCCWN